jgi:hypothetical protein
MNQLRLFGLFCGLGVKSGWLGLPHHPLCRAPIPPARKNIPPSLNTASARTATVDPVPPVAPHQALISVREGIQGNERNIAVRTFVPFASFARHLPA